MGERQPAVTPSVDGVGPDAMQGQRQSQRAQFTES